ncbi:MAG: sulfite exporter TauE/SafE family protein [Gammaproteobacteria bacterium]
MGALVGLALGLTGGGGSIFAVPLLIYVLDIQPQLATTMSLAAVAAMVGFGTIEASINKMVEWRTSLILALGGIICAPLGVNIAGRSNESFIVIGFTILMLLVAVSMWYRASRRPDQAAVVWVNYRNRNETDGQYAS